MSVMSGGDKRAPKFTDSNPSASPARCSGVSFGLILAILVAGCAQQLPEVSVAPVEEEVTGPQPAPPSQLQAQDVPNDAGRVLQLSWQLSPDDVVELPEGEEPIVQGYRLYRAAEPKPIEDFGFLDRMRLRLRLIAEPPQELLFKRIADEEDLPPQSVQHRDDSNVRPNIEYHYRLMAVGIGGMESEPAELAKPAVALRHWFDSNKFWFVWLTILSCGFIVWFIYLAKQGVDLKIRKIAGLEAVDEAVGRATEMGKPILFVPGIADMNEIQTIAGLTILARVGRLCAEYDAKIEVPTRRSLVMTTARETLQTAYMAGGRPDAYHEDMSYYVSDEQFAYVAHLTVYITRQKPAAIFYLGAFFAESLILAETGNTEGAIQIAGTAQPAQLPFFVAACDYTLIGEEFFAASAYLSGEPEQLGTLKGQDMGKILAGILIVIGCTMWTIAEVTDNDGLREATNYLLFQMLGTEEVPEELLEAGAGEDDTQVGENAAASTGPESEWLSAVGHQPSVLTISREPKAEGRWPSLDVSWEYDS